MIDSMLERAQQLIALQRYQDAEKELRMLLSEDPNQTEALALFAVCQSEQGQVDKALTTMAQAIKNAPDDDYLLYLQAMLLFKATKWKAAEAAIKNAIAFHPRNADYYGLLAAIKLQQKEWKDALHYVNEGLAIDPDNLQCLNSRSTALYKLDKKEDAYAAIQNALNQDPENELTHANLGWSLLEKGDHKKALQHFREALKLNPGLAYAKAGMVEALKARYWFYRIFLKYAFWISNFKAKGQWAILLGLYFGIRFLENVAEKNPSLAVLIYPIIYLYVAFALSTWLITPLSNLFLRLNVYGRHALTEKETQSSNFAGLAFAIGLIGFGAYIFQSQFLFLLIELFGVTMMIPLSTMLRPDKKQSQYILIAVTAVLGGIGIVAIIQTAVHDKASILLPIYTFGIVGYQFLANIFATRE